MTDRPKQFYDPPGGRSWDLQVAKMIAWCQARGLTMHVSLSGNVTFRRKINLESCQ